MAQGFPKAAGTNKKCGREAAAADTDEFLEQIILRLARVVKKKYSSTDEKGCGQRER